MVSAPLDEEVLLIALDGREVPVLPPAEEAEEGLTFLLLFALPLPSRTPPPKTPTLPFE